MSSRSPLLLPLVGAIAGAVGALLLSLFGPGLVTFAGTGNFPYRTTAHLRIHTTLTEIPSGASLVASDDPERLMRSNMELVTSRAVLDRVAEETGLGDAERVEGRLTVRRPGGSDLILIDVYGTTPEEARTLADAVVNSFVEYLQADEAKRLEMSIAAYDARIDALRSEYQNTLLASGAEAELDRTLLSNRLDELAASREALIHQLAVGTGGVHVIDGPDLPKDRLSPNPSDLLFGAFVGFVIGGAAAVFLWAIRPPESGAHYREE